MMNNSISSRYLKRLGISFTDKNLSLINEIQSKHIATFTFNSLAVLLNQELPLNTPALAKKIIDEGRGGYCFEHNKLLFDVLQELGFTVRPLLARVVYNRDVDVPRTHRITLLELQGEEYIVDVGFGHFGALEPIKLRGEKAVDQGDETYRIKQDQQGDYLFQIIKDDDFFTLYRFDLGSYTEADCGLSHFYSHKHPEAGFVKNLVVSRKFEHEVRSLRNHEYFLIKNGKTQITPVKTLDHFHSLLTGEFELDVDLAVSQFLFNKFVTKDPA